MWFSGGVLALDGCIYFMPSAARRILKFDPDNETFSSVGSVILSNLCKAVFQMFELKRPNTCIRRTRTVILCIVVSYFEMSLHNLHTHELDLIFNSAVLKQRER